MQKGIFRKGLVIFIIVLFVGAGLIPSMGGTVVEKIKIMDSKSGSYIQDLIDNASDGDTINIPSGIYYENIIIDKSISLIGIDKNITIIDGGNIEDVVYISADEVYISGFTIQKCGIHYNDYGIQISSNNNIIKENTILKNRHAIYLEGNSNIIQKNNITKSAFGIELWGNSNTILKNTISNNSYGIYLVGRFNTIKSNAIINNSDGIFLDYAFFSIIGKNNFIGNERDTYFTNSFINRWTQNYWNESRLLPKPILGDLAIQYKIDPPDYHYYPMLHFDWRPARKTYDI